MKKREHLSSWQARLEWCGVYGVWAAHIIVMHCVYNWSIVVFGIQSIVQVWCCDTFFILKYWTNPSVALKECRHSLNKHKIMRLLVLVCPPICSETSFSLPVHQRNRMCVNLQEPHIRG